MNDFVGFSKSLRSSDILAACLQNLLIMKTFLEELREDLSNKNKKYQETKIKLIKQEIISAAYSGQDSIWVRFIWEHGDYQPIIEYFESQGIQVGSPTGPDDQDFTDYLFHWSL